jgi:hypothetical protein
MTGCPAYVRPVRSADLREGPEGAAQRCGLSPTTVRNVLQKAYRKLSVNSKFELTQLIRESAKCAAS